MRLARRGFAFAALAALMLVSACGDDNDDNGGGTAQDLSGTYDVVKFEQGTAGNFTEIPGVTGILVLTTTTYSATLGNIPVIGSIADEGTYSAIGTETSGTFTQNSTTSGTQATGTYTRNTTTGELVLQTTVNGVDQRVTVVED
ncbi:MAG TPA: hypothetical protein VFY20_08025 [Gemmatimonadales bacterium]|nr:hypothetical protein [Gemmatimonadales bacterium]